MKAIVCEQYAAPEALVLKEVETPVLGAGQVRIEVKAAGLNFVDCLFVQGLYQIKFPTPFIPGGEVAGEVVEVAADVVGFAVGDRVLAMSGLGGFAEQLVIDSGRVLAIPDGLDFARAATLVQSYCTAVFSLKYRAEIKPGEKLLVLGAGGGVGLASCDVGRAYGASVYAAASSEEKLQLASQVGAVAGINYTTDSLKEAVRAVCEGGVDVVVDPIGGEQSEAALRTLIYNGRLLVVGFASGTIPKFPANQVLLRNRRVVGVDWGAWSMAHPEKNKALIQEVFSLFEAGRINPVPPNSYALSDAAGAMNDLLERVVAGKCVLIPE